MNVQQVLTLIIKVMYKVEIDFSNLDGVDEELSGKLTELDTLVFDYIDFPFLPRIGETFVLESYLDKDNNITNEEMNILSKYNLIISNVMYFPSKVVLFLEVQEDYLESKRSELNLD